MRSREIIDKITEKKKQNTNIKKQHFKYIGVKAPYGYIINKKKDCLEIDKDSAFIVYQIYNLYDKGYGFTYIADFLNNRCIVNPYTYNKTSEYLNYENINIGKWEKSSVRKIIFNKVYKGSYKYTENITHEAIVPDTLYENVQDRLGFIKTQTGHNLYDTNGNEFCGKVCCNVCKKSMTIEVSNCKEGKVRYLRCSSYDLRGNHKYSCSNKIAIRYDELRDIVDMFVANEIFNNKDIDIEIIKNEYQKIVKSNFINDNRKYLKMEKKCIEKLINKYNEYKINLKVENNNIYYTKLNNINLELDYLNKRYNEINNLLKELYSLGRTFNVSNNDLYLDKFIIDTFIDKIYIDELIDGKRSIEIYFK